MTSSASRSPVGRNRPWYRMQRWMYRDGHPNALAKLLIRVDVRQLGAGRLVEVTVVVAAVDGERHLVAMLGERTQWVTHIPVDRHAPVAEFEAIAASYPVFRVTAVRTPSGDLPGSARIELDP